MKIRRIFPALCICLFIFPSTLVAQNYYIQWQDTIDNGYTDNAEDVAVDNFNNIIVTGYCDLNGDFNYAYLTVKYDSSGTILWQDTINNNIAIARSVAVDNSNNIIVTGYCIVDGYARYLTVKYDPNGTVLWQDTILNDRHDTALGVAVDNSNNIIVTGYAVMPGPNCDYYTVKYDSNGTILWQDIIDNRTFDYAFGVVTDNSNNIIVTGHSGDPIGEYDYFTVKYDSNGTVLWQDTLIGDIAYDVTVDNVNNIVVTGYCVEAVHEDYFTVKYDSNGTILWQDTLDNGSTDIAHGVAVDNANNIYVTGYSEFSDLDYFTVKYDPNGTILWQDTLNNSGDDFARSIAVDNSNNIIVTGTFFIDDDNDYLTVKYAPMPGVSERIDLLRDNQGFFEIYPNPFRKETKISFSVGHPDRITHLSYGTGSAEGIELKIYDITGRFVKRYDNETIGLSNHIIWDGCDAQGKEVPCGIYFIELKIEEYTFIKKAILLK
jgi:uncharacterized delta-60 repeat protein